jgi:hypothetical protein
MAVPPLKHGPYRAPACRPGDRLVCRMAGGQTVLGFTAAPVPWPYFRGHTSVLRLFLCGDLERAILAETFETITYHFGVSKGVISRWRSQFPPGPDEPRRVARRCKLSDAQVAAIRARHADGESIGSLAREHGVDDVIVWGYVHNYSRRTTS